MACIPLVHQLRPIVTKLEISLKKISNLLSQFSNHNSSCFVKLLGEALKFSLEIDVSGNIRVFGILDRAILQISHAQINDVLFVVKCMPVMWRSDGNNNKIMSHIRKNYVNRL
jgi:hypothetical protein